MMLMIVVAMVMAMAKIFAFRFYISKLPINRLRGRYVNPSLTPQAGSACFLFLARWWVPFLARPCFRFWLGLTPFLARRRFRFWLAGHPL